MKLFPEFKFMRLTGVNFKGLATSVLLDIFSFCFYGSQNIQQWTTCITLNILDDAGDPI